MKKRILSMTSLIVSISIMLLILSTLLSIVEKFYSLIPVPEKIEEYANAFMGFVIIFSLIIITRFITKPVLKMVDSIFMPSK